MNLLILSDLNKRTRPQEDDYIRIQRPPPADNEAALQRDFKAQN